jgi:hypothetical protein
VEGLVKQALEMEMEKIEADAEFKKKFLELSSLGLNVRRERTNKSSILDRTVQVFFLCFVLFAHWFYHCTRVGECRTMYVMDTF